MATPKRRGGARKGSGRPATGQRPTWGIRMPAELAAEVDGYLGKLRASWPTATRTDAVIALLKRGLDG
jgi:hypothetical protein